MLVVLALALPGAACEDESGKTPQQERVRTGEGAGRAAAATPQRTLQDVNPAILYRLHCASCHGKTGAGDGPATQLLSVKPGDWTRPGVLSRMSEEQIRDKILNGTDMPQGRPKPMRGFDGKFRPAELEALVQYVRRFGER